MHRLCQTSFVHIVSYLFNIFLWHESKNINKICYFQNIRWLSYALSVCFGITPFTTLFNRCSCRPGFMWEFPLFHVKMIVALLEEHLNWDEKKKSNQVSRVLRTPSICNLEVYLSANVYAIPWVLLIVYRRIFDDSRAYRV